MVGMAAAIPSMKGINMPVLPTINQEASFEAIKGHHLRALDTYFAVANKPHTQDFYDCYTAYMTFATIAGGACGTQIAAVFSYGPDGGMDQSSFDTAIDTFCDGSCAVDIGNALVDIKTQCADVWGDDEATEEFQEGIRQFLSLLKIPCTRDDMDTKYCAKEFYTASISSDGTDEITENELDTLCKPCVYKMFQQFAAFASDEDAIRAGLYINLMCLNVDGEYCMIYMQDAFPEDSTSGSESSSDGAFLNELDTLCHPCVKLVIDYLSTVFNIFDVDGTCSALNSTACMSDTDDVDCVYGDDGCAAEFDSNEATAIFTLFCIKNADDELCISEFFNAVSDEDGVTGVCPDQDAGDPLPKSCSSKCSNAINDMAYSLGCCTGYIDDYFNLGGDEITEEDRKWQTFFFETCANPDLGDYEECPLAAVTGTFAILNFATDYFQDNKDEIIAWIIADIALASGTSTASIEVTANDVSVASDGTVTVSYTITVTNNDQAEYVQLQVDGVMLALPQTSAKTPLAGRDDFTEALTVSESVATAETFSSDDYETPEADSAAHIGVGLAAAGAVILNL